jgi:hypothetical protein
MSRLRSPSMTVASSASRRIVSRFPRRLPRDYSNETGKVVLVARLGGGPFFALRGLLTGEAAPPFGGIAPPFLSLR